MTWRLVAVTALVVWFGIILFCLGVLADLWGTTH